ncbi:MAG: beta-propeller domain-containing protein [Candidatus Aenigmarchaeota archaeon]|nr:beta-propeller domain-containing protein [Candidatus Aenigmarchaeota archaeon]
MQKSEPTEANDAKRPSTRASKQLTKVYLTAFIIVVVVAIGAAFTMYKPGQQTEDIHLKTFASEQELKDFLKNNQQLGGTYYERTEAQGAAPSDGNAKNELSAGSQSDVDYSQTNIQVEGVDEADFVKNDGKYIYIISNNRLLIVDAYPAENAQILSNITIENENPKEIFVNGNSLIVFSSKNYIQPLAEGRPIEYIARYEQKVKVQIYDISDRSNPVIKKEFAVDGNYHDSRMIGSKVYAIINSHANYNYDTGTLTLPEFSPEKSSFPQIYYPGMPSSSYTFTNVIEFDAEGNFDNKVFLFGRTNIMYVSKDNIYITYEKYVPYYEVQGQLTEKAVLPLLPADVADRVRIAGVVASNPYNAQQARQAELNKYLQTLSTEQQQAFYDKLQERMEAVQAEISKEQQKTIVHKISIKNGIKYEASGEFPGHLLNQFSMDEYNGNLRVAATVGGSFGGPVILAGDDVIGITNVKEGITFEEQQQLERPVPPAPRSSSVNNVYVLDGNLNVIGKLEDLAKGERIFSARFITDRAYLVTFVQVDPLFVIDLSVPEQPKVLGELKIPGVSQYLHPYDQTRILGIGQDAKDEQGRTIFSGVKISLFDVSDVSAPIETDNYIIGKEGTYTPITYDHKAFLFNKQKNIMVIPVTINDYTNNEYKSWSGAYVFSFTPENKISLTGTVAHSNNIYDITSSFYYNPAVERSLYIDNVLYTISQAKIKMNLLADLSEINEIALPEADYNYGFAEGSSSAGAPTEVDGYASGEVSIE